MILFFGGWLATQPCGREEGYEQPLAGSPRAAYCDNLLLWSSPWLILVVPALLLLAGLWLVKTQRYSQAKVLATLAVVAPVLWLVPAWVLPSS